MHQHPVYCVGTTPASRFARQQLQNYGFPVSDTPGWDTKHLLLDVPSFRDGLWTEGAFDTLLAALPGDICIWGGNLFHPSLQGYRTVDFLQNEEFLSENGKITAACTIPIAQALLTKPWKNLPVLVIGWGRIGKPLAGLLKEQGCVVTIASRSASHLHDAYCQGFVPIHIQSLPESLPGFRMIVNTAPASVISEADASRCHDCAKINLASVKGIGGADVHWERALPGRFAPEESGKLIARTFLKQVKEETP